MPDDTTDDTPPAHGDAAGAAHDAPLRVTVRPAALESILADDAVSPQAQDDDGPANGLARLVLSLVNLLHDVLEKQALRRMNNGTLTDDELERVGRTLQKQAQEIEALCDAFNLDPSDLSLPLGTIETHDVG